MDQHLHKATQTLLLEIEGKDGTKWDTEKNPDTGNTRVTNTGMGSQTITVTFTDGSDQNHTISQGGSIEFVGSSVIIRES